MRLNAQTIKRLSSDQAIERSCARTNKRSNDQSITRSGAHAIMRSSVRSSDQTTKRSNDQAIKRSSVQAIKRSSGVAAVGTLLNPEYCRQAARGGGGDVWNGVMGGGAGTGSCAGRTLDLRTAHTYRDIPRLYRSCMSPDYRAARIMSCRPTTLSTDYHVAHLPCRPTT